MQASSLPADQDKTDSKKMWWFRIGAALALAIFGAALYFHSDRPLPKTSPLDPQPARQSVPVDRATDKSADGTAQANAIAPVVAPAASTLEPATPVIPKPANATAMTPSDMAQILERLSKVEASIETLTAAVTKLSSDFAAWVSGHSKPEATTDYKPQSNGTSALRKKPHHKAVPVPTSSSKEPATVSPPAEHAPEVLSIDTWNGQTSVVVRNGADMQFLREGDRTGTYTLKRADKEGQRAFFVRPSGELTVKMRVDQ